MTKPMSILNILLLMALLSWAANTQARDQPSGEETKVTLDQTLEWRMQNGQGDSYRILVSKPEGELPYTGGYPVIYVLDANAYFASLHEAKRAQKQYRQAIIVGIAYPGNDPHNFLRRAYDFSPPVSEEANSPPQGGQDVLLDFLEQQVMPAVAERFGRRQPQSMVERPVPAQT